MEVDAPSTDGGYEYATLACRCSTADRTTAVNLKVAFSDVGPVAFLASAVLAADAMSGGVGVYEGRVPREKAAAASRLKSPGDDRESVRVWLRDARAALIGQGGGDDSPADEYSYYLEELTKSQDDGGGGRLLLLSWKMKLRPIGWAKLGVVQLAEVTSPPAERLIRAFVEPLIGSLSAERKDRARSNRSAAENEKRLLDDNQRLLAELRLVTESRTRNDQRLMAKFVQVLNEKKKRIAAVEQELFELKRRDDGGTSMVEKPATVTDQRRGRGRVRLRKSESNGNAPLFPKRYRTTYGTEQRSFPPEKLKQEQQKDGVDATGLQPEPDGQPPHELGPMETDNTVDDTTVLVAAPQTAFGIPVDDTDAFLADTQIDDSASDQSQQWFRNSIPATWSPRPPAPLKDDDPSQFKNNVFDSLWAGLL